MTLEEISKSVPNFEGLGHSDKIKLFAWHLHSSGKDRIDPAAIRACFTKLHLSPPPNISQLLTGLSTKSKPDLLKDRRGYYLQGSLRRLYDQRYGEHEITVAVRKLLSDLPGRIPDEAERRFLSEALVCFQHKAFRSAIVMTWNLAFFHLTDWIFDNHLAPFNSQIKINFPKSKVVIKKKSDFGDLMKEHDVIEVARSAGIIEAGIKKVLSEKLVKRNTYAHPSLIEVSQLTAEEFIDGLVNNVVLKLT